MCARLNLCYGLPHWAHVYVKDIALELERGLPMKNTMRKCKYVTLMWTWFYMEWKSNSDFELNLYGIKKNGIGTRSVDVNLHRVHFKAEVAFQPPTPHHLIWGAAADATNHTNMEKLNIKIQIQIISILDWHFHWLLSCQMTKKLLSSFWLTRGTSWLGIVYKQKHII